MRFLKHIIILMLFVLSNNLIAQQDAQFTNFMFNKLVINPAYAGGEDMFSVSLFHRSQWVGMSDNPIAPTTQTLSLHSPVGKQPVGLGLNIVNDKAGFQRNLNITASASYFINFKGHSFYGRNKKRLFMGVQAGIKQYSLDVDALDPQNKGDAVIPTLASSIILPEIGVGFLFMEKNFYVGMSIPHLIQSTIEYTDYKNIKAQQVRHYYVTSGYEYELTREITLKPNVLMKYVVNAPVQFDVNALVEYKKMFWGGLSYRTRDAMAFLVGVNLEELSHNFNEKIKIGYSFDWTLSNLPSYNSGSHEIFLIYNINLGEKTLRPKFVG